MKTTRNELTFLGIPVYRGNLKQDAVADINYHHQVSEYDHNLASQDFVRTSYSSDQIT
jgi:hypothetical protein